LGLLTNNQEKTDQFQNFLEYCNREIAKNILGVTLINQTSELAGSRSQGDVHLTVFYNKCEYICKQLANIVNHQLIKRLVDFNFGERIYYPYVKFDTRSFENLDTKAQIVERLYNMGMPLSKQWIREEFNVLSPDEDSEDDLLQKKAKGSDTENPFLTDETEIVKLYEYLRNGGNGYEFKWKEEWLDETENEIGARSISPSDFVKGSFRSENISEKEGISAIGAKLKSSGEFGLQSYRFDKSKGWTKSKVVKWLDEKDVKAVDKG
jgi:phage gp29-like protein